MQTMLQDLRHFLRQAVRNPGFTLTTVISLALGIGATTAVFSVIYAALINYAAALINPYPYSSADRIVLLAVSDRAGETHWADLNGPQILQLRQVPLAESVLAMGYRAMTLTGQELPENVDGITPKSIYLHCLVTQ